MRLEACGSDAVQGSRLGARGLRLGACGLRLICVHAPCVLLAPCVLRAPCSACHAPCSVLRACSVRAPCVLRAPCMRACMLRAPCSVRGNLWELVGTYGNLWELMGTRGNLMELRVHSLFRMCRVYLMKRTPDTIYTIVFNTEIYNNVHEKYLIYSCFYNVHKVFQKFNLQYLQCSNKAS